MPVLRTICVMGCGIDFVLTNVSMQTKSMHYVLYDHVTPVYMGANLSLLREIVHRPELRQQLRQLEKDGEEVMLTVHHSSRQIKTILKWVASESRFSHWWEGLFSGSTNLNEIWSILLHPRVMVLIVQILMIIGMVILVCWVRKRVKRVTSINQRLISG